MNPPINLNVIWFVLVGVLITGYAILDGFDLGVGMLQLFAKKDQDRRILLNAIGPVWDGNEVWLVVGGGALFAAFPHVYATVFSGFYTAFVFAPPHGGQDAAHAMAVPPSDGCAARHRQHAPRDLAGKTGLAFLSSSCSIAGLLALFALGLFPNIVLSSPLPQYSLTIYNAASSHASLKTMFTIALLGMPFVIAYTIAICWIFRGKADSRHLHY